MARKRGWLAFGLTAVLIWAASATWNRAADSPGRPTATGTAHVAVVDIVKVFNEFDQTKVLNQKMSARENDLRALDQKKNQEIETQKAALKAFAPDSAEYKKENGELRKMMVEYQIWKMEEQENMGATHLRWVNRTYDMVSEQVAAVAKAKGIQLVITREDLDTSITDSKVMLKQIIGRKVIYADPSVDISDEVLARLNEAFAKAGGAKSIDFTQ